ncbi:MAG: DUF5131 family protein [Oscillospiraceae bacterium]
MNDVSKSIKWAEKSLNPVIGCSFGCPFCYARRMNQRFGWIPCFENPQFFPERLQQLYSNKSRTIFMDSMSDIADWQEEWVELTATAMSENPQHIYIFLTKRPEIGTYIQGDNVWNGVTITKQREVTRFDDLPDTINLFMSIEPILEPICITDGVNCPEWVIVGAETGNRKGKVVPDRRWIQSIVDECRAFKIPVFLKSSLADIWGAPLIQEYPWEARK